MSEASERFTELVAALPAPLSDYETGRAHGLREALAFVEGYIGALTEIGAPHSDALEAVLSGIRELAGEVSEAAKRIDG